LRAVAIFRGVTVVSEDDAADVRELVVGCERRGSEPRSVEHYRQVLARRLDRKKAHIHALRESDLMPPRDPAIPLVDGAEMDWKILTIRTDDPLAAVLHDVADVERHVTGLVPALRTFYAQYKGGGARTNVFAYAADVAAVAGGIGAVSRARALEAVRETHVMWRARFGAVNAKTDAATATAPAAR
jgi:hypothetical protein